MSSSNARNADRLAAASWRKSSYSNGSGGQCVEVGPTRHLVGVRDTKRRDSGRLAVTHAAWTSFVHSVKAHRL